MAWLDLYLTNWTQTFQVGTNQSGPHRVYHFVPQGSILDLREFTGYTSEIWRVLIIVNVLVTICTLTTHSCLAA